MEGKRAEAAGGGGGPLEPEPENDSESSPAGRVDVDVAASSIELGTPLHSWNSMSIPDGTREDSCGAAFQSLVKARALAF